MAILSHKVADRTKRFDDLKPGTVFALAERKNIMEFMKVVPHSALSEANAIINAINLTSGVLVRIGRNDLCDPLRMGDSLVLTDDNA